MRKKKIPETFDGAMKALAKMYKANIPELKEIAGTKFVAQCHHTIGTYLRNEWFLWWYEGHEHDHWPTEQPKLNAWFNSIGITHADNMSSILLLCFHRTLMGKELEIDKQVAKYQKHWKENGYPDGIPKMKK